MKNTPAKKDRGNRVLNILLVDDSEADVKVTRRAFARAKLRNNIYIATDGQEALDFIFHDGKYQDRVRFPTPDLILLDINMPKVNGFEVLEKLKGNVRYNSIPVIMLTSSKNEEDIVKSLEHGAASFIPKPVHYEDFIKIVEGFNVYWHTINKLPVRGGEKE